MFYLNRKMNEAKESGKIPNAKRCNHIFDPSFDPYRSVLVAPDHLLAGNDINILTKCFL